MEKVFVFGSNQRGAHGAGAASTAKSRYGAIYGRGSGRQGNSYAIPTKDFDIQTLPLCKIYLYVKDFIDYAKSSDKMFKVTAIGTGLAGYSHEQMAKMFVGAPSNCEFPKEWIPIIKAEEDKLNENRPENCGTGHCSCIECVYNYEYNPCIKCKMGPKHCIDYAKY